MHSPSNGIRILGIVCLVLAAAVPLTSQTTTGRILGTVRDQSGAALPAATVTVTDAQRGITRTVTTDDSGEYVVPNLTPGIYMVRAESHGFKTVERPNIQVTLAVNPNILAHTHSAWNYQKRFTVNGERRRFFN